MQPFPGADLDAVDDAELDIAWRATHEVAPGLWQTH